MNTSIELSLQNSSTAQLLHGNNRRALERGVLLVFRDAGESGRLSLMAVGKSTHPSVLWRTGVIQAAERMAALHPLRKFGS